MTAPTLTPLAYQTLSLFADGMEIPAIADETGQDWFAVRQIINVHADGHRTKARRVLDDHPPIVVGVLNAAVAESVSKVRPKPKPKPKADPAPSRERLEILADAIDVTPSGSDTFEPLAKAVTHWALEATDTEMDVLPEPYTSDLATAEGLLAAATDHPDEAVRAAYATAAESLTQLRQLVLNCRRRELVAAEIAACEARLAKLRQWEAK